MRTSIDANIFSAIWSREPGADLIAAQLGKAKMEGALIISPFVFSELLAYPGADEAYVRGVLHATGVTVDLKLDEKLWSEAGLRFARYAARRRISAGEGPRRLLADFLIGAHALVQAERLMTLDPKIYRQDFPELELM
jgi:predicted nucleic acid-binding protein